MKIGVAAYKTALFLDRLPVLPAALVVGVVAAVALAVFGAMGVVGVALPILWQISVITGALSGALLASRVALSILVTPFLIGPCFLRRAALSPFIGGEDLGKLPQWPDDVAYFDISGEEFKISEEGYVPFFVVEEGFSFNVSTFIGMRGKRGFKGTVFNGKETKFGDQGIIFRNSVCPLTRLPYVHPYICKEDGFTYERDALIAFWKEWGITPRGWYHNQIHLYPHTLYYSPPGPKDPSLDGPDPYQADIGDDKPVVLGNPAPLWDLSVLVKRILHIN